MQPDNFFCAGFNLYSGIVQGEVAMKKIATLDDGLKNLITLYRKAIQL